MISSLFRGRRRKRAPGGRRGGCGVGVLKRAGEQVGLGHAEHVHGGCELAVGCDGERRAEKESGPYQVDRRMSAVCRGNSKSIRSVPTSS